MLAVKYRSMVFFDRSIFKRNWSRMNQTPLQRAGVKVMLNARQSIRRVQALTPKGKPTKPSKPGRPPKSRSPGDPFKRIFTVPDKFGTSQIVGPVGFGSKGVPVPAIHEHGLKVLRSVIERRQRRNRLGQYATVSRKRVKKLVQYPERPFMVPALNKVIPQLPMLWRSSFSS